MQILLSLLEQKHISYAEQSENFATDVPAAFSHWVIDHVVDLHQTDLPPIAASLISDLQREIQDSQLNQNHQ